MFKKKKYTVIRQAISKDLAAFIANYFSMQKQVYDTCREQDIFHHLKLYLGYYEGPDSQIPNTYSQYANMAMETLLLNVNLDGKSNRIKIISCIYLCTNL